MTHYTNEYKAAALKLSDEVGIKPAAAELGISYYTLANWRRERKVGNSPACASLSIAQFMKRIRELEEENMTLRKTNTLLLDALALANNGNKEDTQTA